MSLRDEVNAQAEKYGAQTGDSNYFKFEEGNNRLRILNHPSVIATHFFGEGNPAVVCVGKDEGCKYHTADDEKPRLKLVTYVIDRVDNKVKLAELPLSIGYPLSDLQENDDYSFNDFPMPFDVTIVSDPKNKDPKAKYRLTPSPKREELTEEESAAFAAKMDEMTPEDYVESRKKKQAAKSNPSDESEEIHPDDIPF